MQHPAPSGLQGISAARCAPRRSGLSGLQLQTLPLIPMYWCWESRLSDFPCGAQLRADWGRNCVDGQHLLQALGMLPAEFCGKWVADFAERYAAASERYQAERC